MMNGAEEDGEDSDEVKDKRGRGRPKKGVSNGVGKGRELEDTVETVGLKDRGVVAFRFKGSENEEVWDVEEPHFDD